MKSQTAIVKHKSPPVLATMTKAREVFDGLKKSVAAVLSAEAKPTKAQLGFVYDIIKDEWGGWCKEMQDMIRETLLEVTKEEGKFTVEYQGQKVSAERQEIYFKDPDVALLSKLLQSKKLKPKDYLTEDVTYVPNPVALEAAVTKGLITQEELDACRKLKQTNLIVKVE